MSLPLKHCEVHHTDTEVNFNSYYPGTLTSDYLQIRLHRWWETKAIDNAALPGARKDEQNWQGAVPVSHRNQHTHRTWCNLCFDFFLKTERGLTIYFLVRFNVWTSFQDLHFYWNKLSLNWALGRFHSDWLIRLLGPLRIGGQQARGNGRGAAAFRSLASSWVLSWWQLPAETYWEPSGRLGCQSPVYQTMCHSQPSRNKQRDSLAGLFFAYYLREDLFLLELPIAHCQFRQNNSIFTFFFFLCASSPLIFHWYNAIPFPLFKTTNAVNRATSTRASYVQWKNKQTNKSSSSALPHRASEAV